MKFIFLISILLLILSGCETPGFIIPNSPLQLPEIRKAINVVIGKPQLVSLNGREMLSEYHNAKFQPIDDTTKTNDRYQTKVVILGPRRPYEINVTVNVEKFERQTVTYVDQGVDEGLSRQRAIAIKKALNLSLDKKSGFDGDVPF